VLVTDHHAPRADGALPDAPIVHPALCGYPCPELCATAVAYKLAQALFAAAGRDPRELECDLDLVALATVADVVPLRGENRTLVRRGLRALAATAKPGLRALMAIARIDPGRVDERAIAFALAPRLNATGRLYRADAGLELLLSGDPIRAAQVAEELDRANRERRELETRIRWEAEQQLAALGERGAYVLAGVGWHAGVIGIVASRLAERHHRPVVLIALEGERGRGSARSIPAFDLLAGLDACAQHLLAHGGHRAAAGLELESARVADFAQALAEYAEGALSPEDVLAVEHVDAVVGGDELGMTLAEELQQLAPFGRGNPGVSLMLADASFHDARPMGEGKHVRFTVESSGTRARAVAFGTGGGLPVREGEPAEATFKLEVNEWNGVCEPRLVLRQACAAPAGASHEEDEHELVLFAAP
jgi:single-stranded-DNA-specific exonuclease